MTRKDYVKIAAILAETRRLADDGTARGPQPHTPIGPHTAIDHITRELADLMAVDNPDFDRERFRAAAGM